MSLGVSRCAEPTVSALTRGLDLASRPYAAFHLFHSRFQKPKASVEASNSVDIAIEEPSMSSRQLNMLDSKITPPANTDRQLAPLGLVTIDKQWFGGNAEELSFRTQDFVRGRYRSLNRLATRLASEHIKGRIRLYA